MQSEEKVLQNALLQAATLMLSRAKTAPKASGIEHLVYKIAEGEELKQIRKEIHRLGMEKDVPFFIRDAKNLEKVSYILLIGAEDSIRNVPQCGFCGYENCGHKLKNQGRCAYDMIDLGIALGSALSLGQQLGVDSRCMFTVGKAAQSLGMMDTAAVTIGIPMSYSEKNIFFDRMASGR